MNDSGKPPCVHPSTGTADTLGRFEELMSTHADLIRWVVRRTLGQATDLCGEDTEQEVCLAAWRTLAMGKEIPHPSSFFVNVATRIAVRQAQKVRRVGGGEGEETGCSELPAPRVDPGISLSIRRAVEEGLAALTPRRRMAVEAWLAGMNHKEIARQLAWTPSAARHALYDGLAQLRSHLRRQGIALG